MISPHQSDLTNSLEFTKNYTRLESNPENSFSLSTAADKVPKKIIRIESLSTKAQIMKQRDSIFITDSKTPLNLVKFLQNRNLSYIGSDSRYFEIAKDQRLTAAACSGLRLPQSTEAFSSSEVDFEDLAFPLIIKPNREVSEVRGRKLHFIVDNDEGALKAKAEEMVSVFGGVTLEEYVSGREFICLCYSFGADPKTLSPVQASFKGDGLKQTTLSAPIFGECSDEQLSQRITKAVESFFKVVRLSGAFVFTLRLAASELFLIDFEPIVFPSKSQNSAKAENPLESILLSNGITKEAFLGMMVECALLRQEKRKPSFSIRTHREKGVPALFAAKAFEVGEQIYEQQNARENIVIADWVREHSEKIVWGDFWSRRSEGWRPISHSCAPNSQVLLNGVKAIRRIGLGEEITVDFATLFYHELTFDCSCKAENCRKVINLRGQKESWFHEIPSSHFHPWMMDYMFKETLINILNDRHDIIRLQYSPGDCYAVAKRDINEGESVVPLHDLPIQNFNTRHSITKGLNEYFDTTSSYGQFMNHKCQNYNLIINQDSTSMVATVAIPKGQMLTFNYITTEWDICFPFQCCCGQPKCLKQVKGFKDMGEQVQRQTYKTGHCSKFVSEQYQQIS